MSKIFMPMILLCVFTTAFAQTPVNKISKALETKMSSASATDEILVWIYFTDKGMNTDVYFSNPQLVVNEKSIKRRKKTLSKATPLTMRDLPVNSEYISQVKSKGLKTKWPSKWLNAVSGTVSKDKLNEIASLPFVKKLDIVYKLKKGNEPEPDQNNSIQKPSKIQQPNGVNSYDYGDSYAQLQQINVPAVHDLGITGQGVTICLMDAGFNRLSHDAFLSMDIIAAWDFVNNDPNVGNEGDMGNGSHGTMTLSTIGGFAPGHLIGPAFNSSYILAKTENTDSETPIEEDNWIAALEWADSIGVDVTSTSLSYLTFDPPYPSYTWMDMDGNTTVITNGADYAASLGIVVVNSASNDGYNASHNTLGAPADGDSVITAGAVDYSGIRSSFSSVGPTVDGRFKPDIMALGSGDVVASPSNDHNYTTASGTSFSCPLSAGVAALILCSNPNLTPMQVRDAMRNTASQNSNPDNLYGWGILNALAALNYFPPVTTFQLSVDVSNGWNMISVPGINPDGMGVGIWWSNHTGNVWGFDGVQYVNIPTATPGEGYWMKNTVTETYEYPAIQIVPHDPISGVQNWNIIGGYETSVSASGITTDPPNQKTGTIWGFNGTIYVVADNLEPGYGYWIKLLSDCDIIIPEAIAKGSGEVAEYFKEDWGRITMTDAAGISYILYAVKGEVDLDQYEMPPALPGGMFDVRYSSGRVAEDINSSVQTIDMSGITYPLTVKVEGMDIRLQDATGKTINQNLKSGEYIVISDATIQKLMVSGELIPANYSLEQNYPNPFNPSTVIKFSLPENVGNVKLSIYNVLGEKVAELVNTALDAGKYSYQWNAGNVATGMYIYELKTDKFVSIRKMILLR
jgi:subtilisin family serine protease